MPERKVELVAELETLKNEQKEVLDRFQIEKARTEEELLGRIDGLDQDCSIILKQRGRWIQNWHRLLKKTLISS